MAEPGAMSPRTEQTPDGLIGPARPRGRGRADRIGQTPEIDMMKLRMVGLFTSE
jgi:hypothetical protein